MNRAKKNSKLVRSDILFFVVRRSFWTGYNNLLTSTLLIALFRATLQPDDVLLVWRLCGGSPTLQPSLYLTLINPNADMIWGMIRSINWRQIWLQWHLSMTEWLRVEQNKGGCLLGLKAPGGSYSHKCYSLDLYRPLII